MNDILFTKKSVAIIPMLKINTKIKNYKKILILSFLVLFATVIVFYSSSVTYKIGNVFFGNISKLYNVEVSQFFFKKSAYPLIGTSTPFAHYQLSRTYFI